MKSKKYNILVTGIGAIIGYGIIRSLKNSKYDCNIIGIDIFKDAIGQNWCDKFILGQRADSKNFIDFINQIVKEHNVDLILVGIEQDLQILIENFDKLNHHAKYSLNNKNIFEVFHDKNQTYNFLADKVELIPHIHYCDDLYLKATEKFGLPFMLKQDISYASKGVAIIENKEDYEYYLNKFGKESMAQQKLSIKDSEVTCSIFGLGDGDFVNPTCLQRELSGEGATKKATNIKIDEKLFDTLRTICKISKFEGPTNLQFIKYQEKYLLLEVNARISSSTSMREIFGVNEAEMCIEYYIENKIPKTRTQKYGTIIRYIEDIYFDSNHF